MRGPGGRQVAIRRPEAGGLKRRPEQNWWRRRSYQIAAQVLLCVGAVVVYFGIRGLTESKPDTAFRNADLVQGVEHRLGIDWELTLQQQVIDSPTITKILNWIYIFGHWPVIVVTLIWLLARHPEVFRRIRNAMFVSGGIGMVIFAMFPVAPPRLDDVGLVDTVTQQSSAYRILQPAAFTNQYAAMPSLHVGWDLLIGLAIWSAATGRLWLRLIALAMPVAMTLAVVLTGNHYLLDIVAGAMLTTVTWAAFGPNGIVTAMAGNTDPKRHLPSVVYRGNSLSDHRRPDIGTGRPGR